jgi:hypothetical protein
VNSKGFCPVCWGSNYKHTKRCASRWSKIEPLVEPIGKKAGERLTKTLRALDADKKDARPAPPTGEVMAVPDFLERMLVKAVLRRDLLRKLVEAYEADAGEPDDPRTAELLDQCRVEAMGPQP